MVAQLDFPRVAVDIVEKAQAFGVTLRVLGATAFRLHCPEYIDIHMAMEREITDIDFAAYSKEGKKIEEFFTRHHFNTDRKQAALTPGLFEGRHIYENPVDGLHVDIFEDKLNMCHVVNFHNRLHVDLPTIPLAEMTLEKVQIIRMNEKDIKDMLMLFAAHPVGEHDDQTINGKYIADLLSKDWGFYHTTQMNLGKIREGLARYGSFFSAPDVENITARIDRLSQMIEQAPKSLKWKTRAAVGTRMQWYNDVEEVERATHLNDIG